MLAVSRQLPYEVPWASVAVSVLHARVPHSQTLYTLNGAVVGLLAAGAPETHGRMHSEGGLRMTRATLVVPCVGLGIVRAVDVARRLLFIVTPADPADLEAVTVLAAGSLDLPVILHAEGVLANGPYLTAEFSASQVVGGALRSSRTTLARKKYLK